MIKMSEKNTERLSPIAPNGLKKVQVGCGPHNIMPDWWNVDIRYFKGIDHVMDVTKPWPWENILDFIYGEHFIEHINLEAAINFLQYSLMALKPGGKLRLSTPSLEWVLTTHFNISSNEEKIIIETMNINRAFHGWGHKFLYSRIFLEHIIRNTGFIDITFCSYGESTSPQLSQLEKHGGFSISEGFPSVWIVEAMRPEHISNERLFQFYSQCQDNYIKYVESGH